MDLVFYGKQNVGKQKHAYVKDLIEFTADKFFSKRLQKNLIINVHFKRNLLKKKAVYGDCIWEDQHYRPREFTIRLDSSINIAMMLNTLAHEMVHVKQWALGEMYQMQRRDHMHKFHNQVYDTGKLNYWDFPWEIEALGRAIGITSQWAEDRKFKPKVCNKILLAM
jgi:hypothetical protein